MKKLSFDFYEFSKIKNFNNILNVLELITLNVRQTRFSSNIFTYEDDERFHYIFKIQFKMRDWYVYVQNMDPKIFLKL